MVINLRLYFVFFGFGTDYNFCLRNLAWTRCCERKIDRERGSTEVWRIFRDLSVIAFDKVRLPVHFDFFWV